MAGPLFRELAEYLAQKYPCDSILKTGHRDTLSIGSSEDKLKIIAGPEYNRSSIKMRIASWLLYTLEIIPFMLKQRRGTCYFITTNPPFLGVALYINKLLLKAPYCVLVYDIHPQTLVQFGKLKSGSWLEKIWMRLNRLVYNNADAVFTLGPYMAKNLEKSFDVSRGSLGEVVQIPPWADVEKIKPLPADENPLRSEFGIGIDQAVVMYSGNMGISHDIETILEASLKMKEREDIVFLLIGEGEKWQSAVDFKEQHSLTNLKVYKFLPEEMLKFSLPLADLSIVALDSGAEGLMVPSKVFYYLAAGAAVLAVSSRSSELSEIVQEHSCGRVIPPKSPDQMVSAITEIFQNKEELSLLKSNSRIAAEKSFSRNKCCELFYESLQKIPSFKVDISE